MADEDVTQMLQGASKNLAETGTKLLESSSEAIDALIKSMSGHPLEIILAAISVVALTLAVVLVPVVGLFGEHAAITFWGIAAVSPVALLSSAAIYSFKLYNQARLVEAQAHLREAQANLAPSLLRAIFDGFVATNSHLDVNNIREILSGVVPPSLTEGSSAVTGVPGERPG